MINPNPVPAERTHPGRREGSAHSVQERPEGIDHLADWSSDSPLSGIDVGLFLWVLYEVEQVRRLQMIGTFVELSFPDKVHLPVTPFGSPQLLLDEIDKPLSF